MSVFSLASAKEYLTKYSDTGVNIGYAISETALLGSLIPHLLGRQSLGKKSKILELGSGPGRATNRIEQAIKDSGVTNYELFPTEIDWKNINAAMDLYTDPQADVRLTIPKLNMAAETISLAPELFDEVIGTQVIHWIDNLPMFLRGAFRTLKHGGLLAQVGSGIISGVNDHTHFTEHEVYKYFQNCVKEQLIEKGFWDEANGDFSPKNKTVNPKFHRYDVPQIMKLLENSGFSEVKNSISDVPVNSDQMIARMGLGAVQMFLFQGPYANYIPEEVKLEIVNKAREITLRDKAEQLKDLDSHPSSDAVILFIGKKP